MKPIEAGCTAIIVEGAPDCLMLSVKVVERVSAGETYRGRLIVSNKGIKEGWIIEHPHFQSGWAPWPESYLRRIDGYEFPYKDVVEINVKLGGKA